VSPRTGRLCLGWQYATPFPEPGPPPRRPTPPAQERLNPDWATAQRREESLLNRPLKAAFGVAVALGLTSLALGVAFPAAGRERASSRGRRDERVPQLGALDERDVEARVSGQCDDRRHEQEQRKQHGDDAVAGICRARGVGGHDRLVHQKRK